MTDETSAEGVFIHLFGGYQSAPARRWTNKDGTQGGIVAVSASIDNDVIISVSAEVWPDARIGNRASIGWGARIGGCTSIGNDARIGDGTSIGNDANIGDGTSIGYDARIGNDASIGNDARIGNRASIGWGARIGNRASIGWGARIGVCTSIGNDARIGNRASIGNDANIGDRTRIGDDASIGWGADVQAEDWLFVAGPQGSRNTWATAVWSKTHGLRWWVGCQHGISTGSLLERIESDHGDSAHGDDYRALIGFVEGHPGLARAKAKTLKEASEA